VYSHLSGASVIGFYLAVLLLLFWQSQVTAGKSCSDPIFFREKPGTAAAPAAAAFFACSEPCLARSHLSSLHWVLAPLNRLMIKKNVYQD